MTDYKKKFQDLVAHLEEHMETCCDCMADAEPIWDHQEYGQGVTSSRWIGFKPIKHYSSCKLKDLMK